MYLKRIEIQGFKSFADKINIDFSKDLTMIIGPNGSGKSNVLDAIRWVLGEQSSKSLRGQSMQDVIFMGTADRNAVSFASVSLVIDNEDGFFPFDTSELYISRKYFRSGESKYFLNKKECRLLDIQSILMNTGLAKDGYSIIGQGKIDEILSLKSRDRRDFFDEATGVTKFRYKKDEASKRLENVSQNLARLEDILHEKFIKLEPLEKQSLKAKAYLEIASKLRENEINLRKYEVLDLDLDLKQDNSNMQICKDDIYNNKLSSNKNKLEIDKINLEISKLSEKIEEIDQKQDEQTEQYIKTQSKREVLRTNISFFEKDILRIQGEISSIEQKNQQISFSDIENHDKIADIRQNLDLKQVEINQNEQNILKFNSEKAELAEKIKFLNLENKAKAVENLEYELRNTQSSISYTEKSIENHEFLPKAIKFVLQNERISGIINTVAGEIETHEKYSLAINTALGGLANNVISKTSKDAINAINALKREQIGVVTFLPQDKIFARKTDLSKYRGMKGVIGSAIDIIKYDKAYENIIFRALGDTLVMDNSENALKISDNIKIVTLEGEIFHRGGAISGGRTNKNLGIFEYKNKLKTLKNRALELEKSIFTAKKEQNNIKKQFEDLSSEILKINQNNEKFNQDILKINSDKAILEHILQSENAKNISKEHEKEQNIALIDEKMLQIEEFSQKIASDNHKLCKEEEFSAQYDKLRQGFAVEKQAISDKKDVFSAEIINFNKKSTEITDDRISLERELVRFENSISIKNDKKDEILSKLYDKYDITYSEMMEFSTELPQNELSAIVSDLNLQIKGLGSINLDSIDEYIDVKEQYEQLSAQVFDIKRSKEEILKLILDIENQMKDIFLREFNKISIAFEDVFADLFGGGYGYLELSDPSDVLNSGIEIYVCPPGKKEKSLSLLSGGERAFVATAILFAIIKTKPTPFCVLDEIDSALDDINVKKYGSYLQNNAEKTQFIVITHRKGTMQSAKVIYGVTMENKGISKVLKINLEN